MAANELARVFEKIDTNGDGRISESELGQLLRSLGTETATEDIAKMMAEMDKDGDGYVDFNEFSEFYAATSGSDVGSSTSELRDAFRVFDKDGNGLISARELHDVLRSLGDKYSLDDCGRMIQCFDVDGDGHVNFEEFQKMMDNGLTP
ncbi:putative calcium-binding protein CML18 [Silene latifolia]|uniref:putative calcium-binding protein CML18 n=1 Tax=Silene latifolia TaxID=37657 RepID=UPI003D780986